jgi:hypothetical protein
MRSWQSAIRRAGHEKSKGNHTLKNVLHILHPYQDCTRRVGRLGKAPASFSLCNFPLTSVQPYDRTCKHLHRTVH